MLPSGVRTHPSRSAKVEQKVGALEISNVAFVTIYVGGNDLQGEKRSYDCVGDVGVS